MCVAIIVRDRVHEQRAAGVVPSSSRLTLKSQGADVPINVIVEEILEPSSAACPSHENVRSPAPAIGRRSRARLPAQSIPPVLVIRSQKSERGRGRAPGTNE